MQVQSYTDLGTNNSSVGVTDLIQGAVACLPRAVWIQGRAWGVGIGTVSLSQHNRTAQPHCCTASTQQYSQQHVSVWIASASLDCTVIRHWQGRASIRTALLFPVMSLDDMHCAVVSTRVVFCHARVVPIALVSLDVTYLLFCNIVLQSPRKPAQHS